MARVPICGAVANPLSLLPVALAAGGGRVDGADAAGLVAAGFTLRQRSAPLVRAMTGRRSAILLPPSGAIVTALAASDGRGAVLLSPDASPDAIGGALRVAAVGAVFTTRALATQVPDGEHALVLLDDAPRRAIVRAHGAESVVDLGAHFGLDLEGEEDDGSDEECVVTWAPGSDAPPHGTVFSHRNLFALARGAVDAASLQKGDHVLWALPADDLAGLAFGMAGPLLAGARVTALAAGDADPGLRVLERDQVTVMAGAAALYASLLDALARRGTPLAAPALRVCVVLGTPVDIGLQSLWLARTGVELRQAFGVAEAPLCLFNAPHFPNRRGTLGVPFPGVQVSVRDAGTGSAQPVGVAGALSIRGGLVATGSLAVGGDGPPRRAGWLDTPVVVCERPDGAFELAG